MTDNTDQDMQAFEVDMADTQTLAEAFDTVSEITGGLKLLQKAGATFDFNVSATSKKGWFAVGTNIPVRYGGGKDLPLVISVCDGYAEVIGDSVGADIEFINANTHKVGGMQQIMGFVEKCAVKRGMAPRPKS